MWLDGNNKRINPAAVITHNGVTYNGNILMFPEAVAELGLHEVDEPTPPAEYLADPDLWYRTEQDEAPYVVYTQKSAEQVYAILLQRYDGALTDLFERVARAKRYDSRVTCALRAGYPGPFQAEGQAFAVWMDACNEYGYAVMEAVVAGTRALPSVEDFLAEMPEAPWPVPASAVA